MLYVIYRAVFAPLDVFHNHEMEGRQRASAVTVFTAAVLGSVVSPILNYFISKGRGALPPDIAGMLLALTVSVLSWLIMSAVLWALAKAFHRDLGYRRAASVWGLSYIPNLLCVVLYGLLENMPGLYSASNVLAAVFSALFIVLLVWKAIYYFLFLRFVLETSVGEFAAATAVSAVVLVILVVLGARAGIQVPMI